MKKKIPHWLEALKLKSSGGSHYITNPNEQGARISGEIILGSRIPGFPDQDLRWYLSIIETHQLERLFRCIVEWRLRFIEQFPHV